MLSSLLDQFRSNDWVERDSPYGRIFLINEPAAALRALQEEQLVRTSLIRSVMGNGLLASDGEHWERMRRVLRPQFGRELPGQFARTAEALLKERFEESTSVDLSRELAKLTMEVVSRVMLGRPLGAEADALADAMQRFSHTLGTVAQTLFGADLRMTGEFASDLRSINEALDDFAARAIAQPGPYIQALQKEGVDDRCMRDEVVTLLIAGHETTAMTVAWAVHLLGRNPGAALELEGELRKSSSFEDLPFTQRVVQETLRLYPPVWFIARKAVADLRLGDRVIPKDGVVAVIPYCLHRHPQGWSEPESFRPDRFLGKPGPYLPFGWGRHLCPGQRAGTAEAVTLLARLWSLFRIEVTSAPEPQPWLTLRPSPPVLARLERR